VKPREDWYQLHPAAEILELDLRLLPAAQAVVDDVDQVFNLAADMGGMGYIESNKASCMLSVLINTHLLQASRDAVWSGSPAPRRRVLRGGQTVVAGGRAAAWIHDQLASPVPS
jgi:nucleoside-diphosphate-sugar epimerase